MEEKRKLRILVCGESPYVSTGYGQVWLNLVDRWSKLRPDWEIYFINWNSRERKHRRNTADYSVKNGDIGKLSKDLPGITHLPMGKVEFGYDAVEEYTQALQPDFLITLCDVGWQSGYIKVVQEAKKNGWRGKWIAYTPIDTESTALTWKEVFDEPDINVAMAGFGARRMKEIGVKNVVLLPHGVDIKTFYPMQDRDMVRYQWAVEDKFVVGFVGRNQRRKMIDRLIQTFANFAKDKDDVLLLAHTDQEPVKEGWSIPYMIWLFDLKGKVRLTKDKLDIDFRQKVGADLMNQLYNIYDVFLYTTGGEGFGLPGIECQSSGTPLLMTDYSTAEDLCEPENRIPRLKDKYDRDVIDRGTNGVHYIYPDDVEGAKLLEKYYQLWKEKKIDRTKPRKKALEYNWDKIAEDWIKLFEENAM